MNNKTINFSSRKEKSKWLTKRFEKIFSNVTSILDVGCWEKNLQHFLPKDKKYLGIDIDGKPDKIINLDNINSLPLDNNKFDIVVCIDVLEHLENIHLITNELFRVSRKYVLIGLPNPAKLDTVRRLWFKKKYTNDTNKEKIFGKYTKFYGLPPEKPTDRHRWFFTYDEAVDFVQHRAQKNNYSIKTIDTDLQHNKINLNIFYKIIYLFKKDLFISNIFFLLEKNK